MHNVNVTKNNPTIPCYIKIYKHIDHINSNVEPHRLIVLDQHVDHVHPVDYIYHVDHVDHADHIDHVDHIDYVDYVDHIDQLTTDRSLSPTHDTGNLLLAILFNTL